MGLRSEGLTIFDESPLLGFENFEHRIDGWKATDSPSISLFQNRRKETFPIHSLNISQHLLILFSQDSEIILPHPLPISELKTDVGKISAGDVTYTLSKGRDRIFQGFDELLDGFEFHR